jgi:pimeloyl-ACP methyl ester carboxylesterase
MNHGDHADYEGQYEIRTAKLAQIELAYVEQGQGPLLLCVHGFPDVPQGFRHQLAAFARAGYRVVAPYIRGYAPSSVPEHGPYQPAAFGADVLGLIEALSAERAIVYGHDWGSVTAAAAAVLGPERIDRLILSAVPYGSGMGRALLTDPEQQRRSWYIFFFQTALAELSVPLDDFAFIERLWRDWSPGWDFPRAHLQHVKETLARPGVLQAALSYYRSSLQPALRDPSLAEQEARVGRQPIAVPTLYVHGADDGCIGASVSDGMEPLFTGGFRREIVPGAGHFVHAEQPELFNRLVMEFLAD